MATKKSSSTKPPGRVNKGVKKAAKKVAKKAVKKAAKKKPDGKVSTAPAKSVKAKPPGKVSKGVKKKAAGGKGDKRVGKGVKKGK